MKGTHLQSKMEGFVRRITNQLDELEEFWLKELFFRRTCGVKKGEDELTSFIMYQKNINRSVENELKQRMSDEIKNLILKYFIPSIGLYRWSKK